MSGYPLRAFESAIERLRQDEAMLVGIENPIADVLRGYVAEQWEDIRAKAELCGVTRELERQGLLPQEKKEEEHNMSNVIRASYEILEYPENVLVRIERAARTCYKSEERITEGSAEKLVRNLLKRGHHAMTEFGGEASVKFVSNRGFTHEMVRHRLCSFAQESTRYCNYGKGKFGSEITVCDPTEVLAMRVTGEDAIAQLARWKLWILESWARTEEDYLRLVGDDCPAELAREVLPIGVKAEIVVSANIREWRHIFSQRASHLAHPRMRELMVPLLADFRRLMPLVFDDVGEEGLLPRDKGKEASIED